MGNKMSVASEVVSDCSRESQRVHEEENPTENDQEEEQLPVLTATVKEQSLSLTVILLPTSISEVDPTIPKMKETSITLSTYPLTGLDLKLAFQHQYQIPVCLQTLTLQSLELADGQNMKRLHLREGDIIRLTYTSHGDLTEIQAAIDSMRNMYKVLKETLDELTKGTITSSHEVLLMDALDPLLVKSVVDYYFILTPRPKAKANHLYFVCNGGLSVALDIHNLLTEISCESQLFVTQLLEHSILTLLFYLSSLYGIRYLIKEHPGVIAQLSKSVLRVHVIPYKAIVAPNGRSSNFASDIQRNTLLAETMYEGMNVIVK